MTARPTPARVAPGRLPSHTYRHRDGWRLFVPLSLQRWPDGKPLYPVAIGQHVPTLNHRDRTVAGTVPPSWRVNLHGPHPDDVAS